MIQADIPRVAVGLTLIFDLDGVIVDSNPIHRKAWVEYNRRFGMDTDEAMLEFMYGKRNDDIVRHYFGAQLAARDIARHGAAKEELYREMISGAVDAHMVPGVREFMEANAEAPMALASNAEPANISFLLDATGLRRFFRAVVDGHQVREPKPDPEIFLRAARLLGAKPRNTIIFEDSYAGVQAARSAGARVVGLRTTHPELPAADVAVDDFLSADLRAWLQRQKAIQP